MYTRQKETTTTHLPSCKSFLRSPHTSSRVTQNRLSTRKKIKRRYDDDRFVFKIYSLVRYGHHFFLRITIPSGRDIEAHRGFSVIWSSRNPSPQKCYVCVCVIIDLSSPILNYESPSKRRLFQIHACDMNRWYIVTRDVKISIFSPRRSKKFSCPLRYCFF